jgi:D-alanine-D-alanine ligase
MKKKIAVACGGNSGEYEISIQSGRVVSSYLDRSLYEVYPIYIRGNDWYGERSSGEKLPVDRSDFTLMQGRRKIRFDCVFIAIHGTPGEDGKLQGYFDLLELPYTGCGQTTSALTFNKYFCKNVVAFHGVKTAPAMLLHRGASCRPADILSRIKLPCFVKPNNGGSSVGMSKVNAVGELQPALKKAFDEDREVLVEEFISGREITCGLFRHRGKIIVLPLTEIKSKREFFDYQAKYTSSLSQEIVPASLTANQENLVTETSSQLYGQLNCKGIVRFDYILNKKGVHFLEVNTVPGLTEASIVPKMANHAGISLKSLFTMLVQEELSRGKAG